MTSKASISLTDEHARMISNAVESGEYASASEVIREALRDWRQKQAIGLLWDEGLASGLRPEGETGNDIKKAARLARSG